MDPVPVWSIRKHWPGLLGKILDMNFIACQPPTWRTLKSFSFFPPLFSLWFCSLSNFYILLLQQWAGELIFHRWSCIVLPTINPRVWKGGRSGKAFPEGIASTDNGQWWWFFVLVISSPLPPNRTCEQNSQGVGGSLSMSPHPLSSPNQKWTVTYSGVIEERGAITEALRAPRMKKQTLRHSKLKWDWMAKPPFWDSIRAAATPGGSAVPRACSRRLKLGSACKSLFCRLLALWPWEIYLNSVPHFSLL